VKGCPGLVAAGVSALLIAAAAAEQVYRWVDENGVVNFSNLPRRGAEPLQIGPAPAVEFDLPSPSSAGQDGGDGAGSTEARGDYQLTITNLRDGQVVWNDARRLELAFDIQPSLEDAAGRRLQVFVDGERRAVLDRGDWVVLEDIDRGTHRIWAELVGADGRRLAASDRLTVHHKQHSVQRSPGELRRPR
jgi:hypothetical protein